METADGPKLLRFALERPFEEPGERHIDDWFHYLTEHFPLWSLQPHKYGRLHAPYVAIRTPLRSMVRSIRADESSEDQPVVLADCLQERRIIVMSGAQGVAQYGLATVRRPNVYSASTAGFYWSEETEGAADYLLLEPEYALIGRRLVQHIEDIELARDSRERQEALHKRDKFLNVIAAGLPQGAPEKGPGKPIRDPLYSEFRKLLDICWGILPAQVTGDTKKIFAANGVSEKESVQRWAAALTLPFFSRPEISALFAQREASRNWGRRSGQPTARRFTVWLLAHRLGVPASTLARPLLGPRDSEYFAGRNPMANFLQ